jgi:hypothetical protein
VVWLLLTRQQGIVRPFFEDGADATRDAGETVPAGGSVPLSLPLYRICSAHFVTSPTHALIECERRPFLPWAFDVAASLLFLTKRFGVEVNEERLSYGQKVNAFFRRVLFFFRLRAFSSYKEPSVAYLLSQDSVLPILDLCHQWEHLIRSWIQGLLEDNTWMIRKKTELSLLTSTVLQMQALIP